MAQPLTLDNRFFNRVVVRDEVDRLKAMLRAVTKEALLAATRPLVQFNVAIVKKTPCCDSLQLFPLRRCPFSAGGDDAWARVIAGPWGWRQCADGRPLRPQPNEALSAFELQEVLRFRARKLGRKYRRVAMADPKAHEATDIAEQCRPYRSR
jgi:hypothetical protein